MTTQVTTIGRIGTDQGPSLEALVDRVIDALFPKAREEPQNVARSIHDARRLRKAGDLDGALALLSGTDTSKATEGEKRWLFSEWLTLAKRTHGERAQLLYSPGTGRAAVLAPCDDRTVEVLAALGMRWKPGKSLSGRSLRGLRPLKGGE